MRGRVGRDGREQVPTLAAQHERDNWAPRAYPWNHHDMHGSAFDHDLRLLLRGLGSVARMKNV